MNHEPLSRITAGVWQFDIRPGDVDGNLKNACGGIDRLAVAGADLAVLPEMFSCGFDYPHLLAHAEKTPAVLETLSRLAQRYGMVIAGSLPEASGSEVFNCLYVIDADGRQAAAYRKIHLFPPILEDHYLRAGQEACVCETAAGRLGLLTCFDLRFPELARSLALQGAQILAVSAQWPKTRIMHWDVLLRARAIENQVFVVAANRYGEDPDLFFNGHSRIISPAGEERAVIAAPNAFATAFLDFAEIREARSRFNCLTSLVPQAYEAKWPSREH
jgi:predicted amidohydrolase